MKFAKQSSKYFIEELKGNITNNFNFCIKSLHQDNKLLEEAPLRCAKCSLPFASQGCQICELQNLEKPKMNMLQQTEQNLIYRQKITSDQKMQQIMILCIDLSGSMCYSYKSKYNKVNEQSVKRVLGQKNFQYFKKKIGIQRVMKNYQDYAMFLNEGQTARNIVQMVKMQEKIKYGSSYGVVDAEQSIKTKQINQQSYISRKQIVEIAVAKLLTIMKGRFPNTYITVVYFNDSIQIPTDDFNQKMIISGIQKKSVEEMINLGIEYSMHISKAKSSNVGQNLAMNLTKANQNGQTALGPALAFCLGLAKSFKFSLNQIVVVTDGVSNIGFGETENEAYQQQTKKFYEELAIKYSKPLNSIVDIITFQDCCIGYDQLDGLVSLTGGIPCQIQFNEIGGQKTVTQETFSSLSFKMVTNFCQYVNQLCFETKITILCNNKNVTFNISEQMKPFIILNGGHYLILNTQIISSSMLFEVCFNLPKDLEQFCETIKFTVICQYKRNNRLNVSKNTKMIKIIKGTKQQAEKQELKTLQKQMKQKLKTKQIFQENIQQYQTLSFKIQNKVDQIDKDLLEKFNKKKQKLEKQMKDIDKLARQKLSMRSRAQKTYKAQDDNFDDGFI